MIASKVAFTPGYVLYDLHDGHYKLISNDGLDPPMDFLTYEDAVEYILRLPYVSPDCK